MGKIITQCEHCEQKMNVDEEFLGKKIRCPNCKKTFPIKEYQGQMTASIPHETDKEDIQERPASAAPFSTGTHEEEEIDEVSEEFQEFETSDNAKSPSYAAAPVEVYNQPQLGVFKNIVPENAKIIGEYNLGCCGLIVPECTKVLITENEVYVNSSRRFIFGIFPGGRKIASYPIEFPQMRSGMLKYSSLFAALLFLIFGLAIGLGAWFVAKTAGVYEQNDKMYCLETMFDFSENTENQPKLSKLSAKENAEKKPVAKAEEKCCEKTSHTVKVHAFLMSTWYYLIPFVITLIWILFFWKSVYKTCLFIVPVSRFRRKTAQACLRKINEQALRIQK